MQLKVVIPFVLLVFIVAVMNITDTGDPLPPGPTVRNIHLHAIPDNMGKLATMIALGTHSLQWASPTPRCIQNTKLVTSVTRVRANGTNMLLLENRKDGSCFFEAVAAFLCLMGRGDLTQQDVRDQLANYIETSQVGNRDLFMASMEDELERVNKLPADRGNFQVLRQAYANHLRRSCSGGLLEIAAFADIYPMFHVNLYTLQGNGREYGLYNTPSPPQLPYPHSHELSLAYSPNGNEVGHYALLFSYSQ
jgi:hypothetical protein